MTPDWEVLNYLALEGDNLPAVLADMGFVLRLTTWKRGELASWPDSDWDVMLLAMPDRRCVLLDTGSGRWRASPLGLPRGRDLASLGAWAWGCRYGRAAWRVARCCGHSRLPDASWRNHEQRR